MWGEVDLSAGWLVIEPRLWNEDKGEYKWDVDAGYLADQAPGRDGFRLRLPKSQVAGPAPPDMRHGMPTAMPRPPGWQVMDRTALAQVRSQPPPTETMVDFFNCFLPSWPVVLAAGVRPRAIAGQLVSRLRAVHGGAPKALVVLLAAAGGEGKSTALLHAAAALIEDQQQSWTCLHRHASAAPLPDDLFAQLPATSGHSWVVVIDDADTVGPSILAAVKRLAPRTDVHLLLAARDAEWRIKRLVPGLWEPFAHFQTVPLTGVDEEDTRRIVAGWCAWGHEVMGRLHGCNEAEATAALLVHARDFAARKDEGALLGALLITRLA